LDQILKKSAGYMESYWEALKYLESLKKISIALSAEKDLDEFFKLILDETIKFTNSDAGTIYTVSEDQRFLDFQIVCTISKQYQLGRADIKQWPSISLYNPDNTNNLKNFVCHVYHTGETMSIEDVYAQDIFDNSGTRKYDEANNYHSKSMLGIPLKNHEDKVLGVLQLINALDNNFEIVPFRKEHIALVSSIASQAAIALTNRSLIIELENLFDQVIRAIAEAIDKKSKYTGGHITRVADLTRHIAEGITADNKYYPSICFSSDEIKELMISSWMHDLGKITTPDHIMDKATRLETITDRIEMISLRYQMIRELLLQKMAYLQDSESLDKDLIKDKLKQLENDWQFIQKINLEQNYIEPEISDRIENIFQTVYMINDKEYCLIDKLEKEYLQIEKGTLSKKESDIMKEHVIVTHQILSELTFPTKFNNVPLYASLHHETLNGKGYPFQYRAERLPLQARIIAIADIFESLTARDRPYKKGKHLSKTLQILGYMVRDKEIDKNLVDLILDEEIYLEYAKKYLLPDQIDPVDVKAIKKIYKNETDLK